MSLLLVFNTNNINHKFKVCFACGAHPNPFISLERAFSELNMQLGNNHEQIKTIDTASQVLNEMDHFYYYQTHERHNLLRFFIPQTINKMVIAPQKGISIFEWVKVLKFCHDNNVLVYQKQIASFFLIKVFSPEFIELYFGINHQKCIDTYCNKSDTIWFLDEPHPYN